MSKRLTLAEAGEVARCCPETVRRYVKLGVLPASLCAGRYLIAESDLIVFMDRVKPTPKRKAVTVNAPSA